MHFLIEAGKPVGQISIEMLEGQMQSQRTGPSYSAGQFSHAGKRDGNVGAVIQGG
jgi:hypothetical protein